MLMFHRVVIIGIKVTTRKFLISFFYVFLQEAPTPRKSINLGGKLVSKYLATIVFSASDDDSDDDDDDDG